MEDGQTIYDSFHLTDVTMPRYKIGPFVLSSRRGDARSLIAGVRRRVKKVGNVSFYEKRAPRPRRMYSAADADAALADFATHASIAQRKLRASEDAYERFVAACNELDDAVTKRSVKYVTYRYIQMHAKAQENDAAVAAVCAHFARGPVRSYTNEGVSMYSSADF